MAKLTKSVFISAPPEKPFSYIDDPTNLPEIWPSFVEAKDVERLPTGGSKFGWTYKMAGIRFDGTTDTIEYEANQRIVTQNEGGVSSVITWTFELQGDGTKVTFEADYTVNLPMLRKLAESVLVKANEQEAETLLANLKSKIEA